MEWSYIGTLVVLRYGSSHMKSQHMGVRGRKTAIRGVRLARVTE